MLKKFCRKQGCMQTVEASTRYCSAHEKEAQGYDQYRESAAKRGYGSRWRKARETYLKSHPLCVKCEALGFAVAATDLDHIIPHKGDQELFWDRDNWQPLCHSHHSQKTVQEDGGFGR